MPLFLKYFLCKGGQETLLVHMYYLDTVQERLHATMFLPLVTGELPLSRLTVWNLLSKTHILRNCIVPFYV